ncbi:hypothetical protein ACMXYV_05530 [Neptuniibacter sp. SY11_33]|uniref:hypothetical protein n=1 Tax=Neptuniibacter sp. SY11_33 TaxID=3398215 RepID=UPI0039F5AFBB
MIFAEIASDVSYYDIYPKLLQLVQQAFSNVESGVQGDAWIWIYEGEEKVALDTFTSMRFQIKSDNINGLLVQKVISKLDEHYELYIYDDPELEGHEDTF